MDATSIQTAQGLVFPVRLHNSFLLDDPRILLAGEDQGCVGAVVEALSELWPPAWLFEIGWSASVLTPFKLPALLAGPVSANFMESNPLFLSVFHDPTPLSPETGRTCG